VRVLCVDDDADTVESLSILLELSGVEVRTARDGPTALRMVQEFAPRVVLLDLGLPGMDGWQVAGQLKALEKPPFILALSGYARDEDHQKSAAAHIDLHLAKPADPQFLIQLLQRLRAG
jgi:CheY-like chemotaxis protein